MLDKNMEAVASVIMAVESMDRADLVGLNDVAETCTYLARRRQEDVADSASVLKFQAHVYSVLAEAIRTYLGQYGSGFDGGSPPQEGEAQVLAERIKTVDITIKRGKEWSGWCPSPLPQVTAKEIVDALAGEGIKIEEDMVDMTKPINTLGLHGVEIKLHPKVVATLKVWVWRDQVKN